MRSVSHVAMAAVFAAAVAGAGLAASASAIRVQDDCDDLRQACLDRDAMGERGQGNCRRFRDRCGVSPDYCARLLETCIQAKALGLKHERSCRHYRLECQA